MNTPGKDRPSAGSEQSLRSMLERATADPDPSLEARVQRRVAAANDAPLATMTTETKLRRSVDFDAKPRRMLRALTISATALVSVAVVVGATLFVTNRTNNTVVAGSTSTPATSAVRLDLDLRNTAPQTRITPRSGPALDLVVVNQGKAQQASPGVGWSFLQGGQQRDNAAFLTVTGPAAARLFDPSGGRLSIGFTSQSSLDQRTVTTGRNSRTYVQLTSDDTASQNGDPGPADLLKVALMIDPEIGPYLSVSVAGANTTHALTEAQQQAFDAGRRVMIDVSWADGLAKILLNEAVISELSFDPRLAATAISSATTSAAASLSIGASADYGAGYFSVADDALETIRIESATET
jgi:hypothetical protein